MRFDGGEILDAFHELPPQYWSELYAGFEALLLAYAENEGALKTIANSASFCAAALGVNLPTKIAK